MRNIGCVNEICVLNFVWEQGGVNESCVRNGLCARKKEGKKERKKESKKERQKRHRERGEDIKEVNYI